MARSPEALINAEMLVWARESAQMTLEVAAERLGVKPERLESWESGEALPTINQVRTMARVYEQSFAAFYLPEPPPVFRPPTHDYRLMPDMLGDGVSPALASDMRRALDRREILVELARENDLKYRKSPIPEIKLGDPGEAANQVRKTLDVSMEQQRSWRNPEKAFANWRSFVERLDILVFQAAKVPLEEMRGYSITKSVLPIVVVNRKDRPAGRCFTLLHEVCHLALRNSGVCDLSERRRPDRKDEQIEVFCNEVAGRVLVPSKVLQRQGIVRTHEGPEWSDVVLSELAREFAVSREVILRRLLTLNKTTPGFYARKRTQFLAEYEQIDEEPKTGFVPPSVDAVSQSGKPYVTSVLTAFFNDKITASDASDYLGVRINHFDKISEAVGLK